MAKRRLITEDRVIRMIMEHDGVTYEEAYAIFVEANRKGEIQGIIVNKINRDGTVPDDATVTRIPASDWTKH